MTVPVKNVTYYTLPALFCDLTQRRIAVTQKKIGINYRAQAFFFVSLRDPQVVPKRRYRTTIPQCVKPQKAQI
jgi:hypothetical protein